MRSKTAPKANPAARMGIAAAHVRSLLKASRSWTLVFVSIKHRQHEDRREKRNLLRAFLYRSDACHAEAAKAGGKRPRVLAVSLWEMRASTTGRRLHPSS